MNSVERVAHYIHNLKPEPDLETPPDNRYVFPNRSPSTRWQENSLV